MVILWIIEEFYTAKHLCLPGHLGLQHHNIDMHHEFHNAHSIQLPSLSEGGEFATLEDSATQIKILHHCLYGFCKPWISLLFVSDYLNCKKPRLTLFLAHSIPEFIHSEVTAKGEPSCTWSRVTEVWGWPNVCKILYLPTNEGFH